MVATSTAIGIVIATESGIDSTNTCTMTSAPSPFPARFWNCRATWFISMMNVKTVRANVKGPMCSRRAYSESVRALKSSRQRLDVTACPRKVETYIQTLLCQFSYPESGAKVTVLPGR